MWICVLGTGALGAQKMELKSMLPELLWEPNSGPRCTLLTAEPLPQSCSSFSAGRVVSLELFYRYPHSNMYPVTVTEYLT